MDRLFSVAFIRNHTRPGSTERQYRDKAYVVAETVQEALNVVSELDDYVSVEEVSVMGGLVLVAEGED